MQFSRTLPLPSVSLLKATLIIGDSGIVHGQFLTSFKEIFSYEPKDNSNSEDIISSTKRLDTQISIRFICS